jgi:hypothetical protein
MANDPPLDSLDPLTRALRERGFELFVAVRVASPVQNKIGVIKEVRTLTGVGLKEAKDAVEQEQVILDALAPDQAERVSERLAAAGGHSALLLARGHLYAFMPDHPLRGSQTCERLTVVGHTLELSRGQLGKWGPAQMLPISDAELLAVIDRQRASWAAAGWLEAGSELEIVERVSERNEQLEARICAAEGDALVGEAAVYGDWLQSRGDPRGYVASSALALDAAPDGDARAQRAAQLAEVVAEHAAHLFGPVRPLLALERMQLEWLGPMISSAALVAELGGDFEHMTLFERLLALPASVGIRRLAVGQRFAEYPAVGELLARSSCAASLRSLSVTHAARVSFVGARFERLEQLELSTQELAMTSLAVPALRRLTLDFRVLPPKLEPCLAGLDAPMLEHFEFSAYVHDYWDHHNGPLQSHLADVLRSPSFGQLRSLTLRSHEVSLPYQGGLARIFERLPARGTLERIDLRQAALSPQARAELEAARGSLPELLLDP